MSNLYVLHGSPSAQSLTRTLTDELVADLQSGDGQWSVTERDLAALPVPGLTTPAVAGMFRPLPDRTALELSSLSQSDLLIGELERADAIVLGTPMYNHTVPAQVKAWIDQVVMPGRTFAYVEGVRRGLLRDRPVVIITASGGEYETDKVHQDFLHPYLRHILGWMGLLDLHFVRAADVLRGVDASLEAARGQLAGARVHLQSATPAAVAA